MQAKKLNQLIQQMENYLECWKQFNRFLNLARAKQFTPEDEQQFLEVKSIITQELELILASIEGGETPSRQEIHDLIASAPSIRFLSEVNEGVLRAIESRWHKIYIGWHAVVGQLKVQQRAEQSKSLLGAMFEKKAS